MSQSLLFEHVQAALLLFAHMAGPPLAVAVLVGLIVGILQAATQIQDQILPLTFKLITVFAVLAATAGSSFIPLVSHTERVFNEIPRLSRPS